MKVLTSTEHFFPIERKTLARFKLCIMVAGSERDREAVTTAIVNSGADGVRAMNGAFVIARNPPSQS